MKVINTNVLFEGKVEESVIVSSFDEYKRLGGKRDILDLYSFIKERAKRNEGEYISMMDMSLSGIPVDEEHIRRKRLMAQAQWYLLHLWFQRPLRKVSFLTFDLEEFNRL